MKTLLFALALALVACDFEESNSNRGADALVQQELPVAPIPEPSGALLFSLALCVLCVRGAWEAGKR